jgi:hypothetical protein
MDLRFEWLNEQIDLIQADKRLNPGAGKSGYMPDAGDLTALRMAVKLNAARPGAGKPDPDFLAGLRARVLAAVVE